MIKNEFSFIAGPFDGWRVEEGPSFQEHYYVPIDGPIHHYYRLEGSTYAYMGEVEVVSAG